MSNQDTQLEYDCSYAQGCSAVELLITPKLRDLGGFSVRRVLPSSQRRAVGPWVFFDHMGPAVFAAGTGINVRPHPHINLATVSYLFEGEILHRDSLGTLQPIQPGDINLMVAGTGIVHSERERPEVTALEHRLHGLQLWLALPEKDEETAPAFYHYPGSEIPATQVDGVPVRVLMGQAFGVSSPVKTFATTLYAEARLQAGQQLTLPDAEELAVYVLSGEVAVGDTRVPAHSMAVLSAARPHPIQAHSDSIIALVGGERLSERHMEWNFISSRPERIEQAKADWAAGRFAQVPGDTEEFIPLPE
ncbi:pirin family protein [Halopseudomonas maritima]|uniref:pirin family protein n=1 Tax=Halopseudomonas maritima TaxID=2918528 RepID=UPI001EEC9D2F|nr:pirin family protein [Halopseudomonas maritima]UJJ32261.1 pirin family protein [Halopseudomonas maritima]